MKKLLARPQVLWFLFLFNLMVAVLAPFVIDGARALATTIGMGVVSIGAGISLLSRARSAKSKRTRSARLNA